MKDQSLAPCFYATRPDLFRCDSSAIAAERRGYLQGFRTALLTGPPVYKKFRKSGTGGPETFLFQPVRFGPRRRKLRYVPSGASRPKSARSVAPPLPTKSAILWGPPIPDVRPRCRSPPPPFRFAQTQSETEERQMEVTIKINGQALSVEVSVEVYECLDRADH